MKTKTLVWSFGLVENFLPHLVLVTPKSLLIGTMKSNVYVNIGRQVPVINMPSSGFDVRYAMAHRAGHTEFFWYYKPDKKKDGT